MSKRILVVEDEDNTRRLYEEEFKEAGYKVICAIDGLHAVKIAEKEHIDLVVTDIRMSEGSGKTVALWFYTFRKEIPVIVVTAYPHYEDMLMGEDKYVRAFFTKPVDMSLLKKTMADILKM